MKLWLDDIRPTPKGWKHYKDAYGMIYALDEYASQVEEISLDHDLGDGALYGTGYDVMKYLEEKAHSEPEFPIPPVINFHTANPIGNLNMERALDSIQKVQHERLQTVTIQTRK